MRALRKFLPYILIGGIFFYLSQKVEWSELSESAETIHWWLWSVGLSCWVFSQFAFIFRWKILLGLKNLTYKKLALFHFSLVPAGLILSMTGADLAKLIMMKDLKRGSEILGSLIFSRGLSIFTLSVLGLVFFPLWTGSASRFEDGIIILLLLVFGACVLFSVAISNERFVSLPRKIVPFLFRYDKFDKAYTSLINYKKETLRPVRIIPAVFASIVYLGSALGSVFFILEAISMSLGALDIFYYNVLIIFSGFIPFLPMGGAGSAS